MVKIIAMGFVVPANSYLRDSWNIMDFLVVMLSWVTTFYKSSNVSVIRIVRVLRPLRTISSFPALSKLVRILILLTPGMVDIFSLALFVIMLFATIALQML